MVDNIRRLVESSAPEFTGTVFRYAGGAVEVRQLVGESDLETAKKYQAAIEAYKEAQAELEDASGG